jgi:stearoyl-CoA desaturase (delta-9 desaturase)
VTRRHSFRTYFNLGGLGFWGVHLAAILGVVLLGFSWSGLALALAFYVTRMFFVTGAYHRYFSHRTYKTSRWFQAVLAFGAQTALQRGVLWWAAHHRHHHKHSDQEGDVHSPRLDGFWFSHLGWSTSEDSERFDGASVKDLARFPELRWLNKHKHTPGVLLAIVLFLVGGAHALVWGFFVSTVLLWHGTFTINSLSHVIGSRRYATTDDSRNHWLLALITLGEGWHNNHHHYMTSTRQGFRWYEIDLTYYGLRALAAVGLVWDLREPPAHVVENRPRPAAAGSAARALARSVD